MQDAYPNMPKLAIIQSVKQANNADVRCECSHFFGNERTRLLRPKSNSVEEEHKVFFSGGE